MEEKEKGVMSLTDMMNYFSMSATEFSKDWKKFDSEEKAEMRSLVAGAIGKRVL